MTGRQRRRWRRRALDFVLFLLFLVVGGAVLWVATLPPSGPSPLIPAEGGGAP